MAKLGQEAHEPERADCAHDAEVERRVVERVTADEGEQGVIGNCRCGQAAGDR